MEKDGSTHVSVKRGRVSKGTGRGEGRSVSKVFGVGANTGYENRGTEGLGRHRREEGRPRRVCTVRGGRSPGK